MLDRRVLAERYGAEPGNVLALHGWGRTRDDFAATLTGLEALALDLPGFGTTAAPDAGWSTARYAELLVPLLAEMDRPVIVGHSFGGRVAAHLGATRPSLLRGIVFTGAPLLRGANPRPALRYRVVKALAGKGIVPQSRLDAARTKRGSPDYRATSGVMREVFVQAVNEDYTPQLAAMAAAALPVRFVCGEFDTAAPVSMSNDAALLCGAPAPTVVAGSAHLLDAPLSEVIKAAVVELLAPVPG